ncbi:hypothetical protein C5748_01420 [Phyllobacterium phragmitis]|uniref:Uncharacterized protein n=2 Tax=Phyllobacterium phragmitis TaxID=2670329 RepID=A0A2S9IZA0_9HYPH|nr:hypothetical protein C5748_01420 [Phyllobacterium phragmitis]
MVEAEALKIVQKAFIGFSKRAEKVSSDILYSTYVDTEPLSEILMTSNNQIIYGRRGTGKTHALIYLSEEVKKKGDFPIYIDLRSIGSDGAIYNDLSRTESERSVRLILDVLRAIGSELWAIAINFLDKGGNSEQISSRLDDLDAAFSEVKILGEITTKQAAVENSHSSAGASIDASLSQNGPKFGANVSGKRKSSSSAEVEKTAVGREVYSVHFGRIQNSLRGLIDVLGKPRIWILIDEWSEIPISLQPYLADLLRRTILPINHFIIKIGAIEHRSNFHISRPNGEYIGLELGADISADLNLDDFLVFDNDQARSVSFYKNLLFRHLEASEGGHGLRDADQLIQFVFTQVTAFEELVRASEGVPRDALNLASKIAAKAFGRTASVADIRVAARDWYQNDKASAVKANVELAYVLDHIINRVIGERRARAFLVPANIRNEFVDRLFDSRIIHLLKKNISSHDTPGIRYDVFKIDYGCYVELINTQKATLGLFEADDGTFVEVPADDYRSIRRAILDLDDLAKFELVEG